MNELPKPRIPRVMKYTDSCDIIISFGHIKLIIKADSKDDLSALRDYVINWYEGLAGDIQDTGETINTVYTTGFNFSHRFKDSMQIQTPNGQIYAELDSSHIDGLNKLRDIIINWFRAIAEFVANTSIYLNGTNECCLNCVFYNYNHSFCTMHEREIPRECRGTYMCEYFDIDLTYNQSDSILTQDPKSNAEVCKECYYKDTDKCTSNCAIYPF